MGRKGLHARGIVDVEAVASYLRDLVGCLEEGVVCIQRGDEFVTLRPADRIEMEIEAKRKNGREKFVLELSWQVDERRGESDEKLYIGSRTPARGVELCDETGMEGCPEIEEPELDEEEHDLEDHDADDPCGCSLLTDSSDESGEGADESDTRQGDPAGPSSRP